LSSPAAAAPSATARLGRDPRRLLLGLPLLLLLRLSLRRRLRLSAAVAAAFLLRSRLLALRALARRRPSLVAARSGAYALLEFLHFPLHVAARLRFVAETDLVVAAVGTALPSLGVCLPALRAKDAFRQWHSKSARIVHFAAWRTTGAARCAR
jgi:hypothetical protein